MARSTSSSRRGWWPYLETIRAGYLEFRATNPWRVTATTTWPRAVLQCLFYVLLGKAVTGDHSTAFAFTGSVALILTLSTSISIATVPVTDKNMGTFYRLRLGRPSFVTVLALRAMPWLLEALIMFLLSTVVVGAMIGELALAVRLLTLTPMFLVMAVANAAAGLAVAALAIKGSAEVLLGNALMYLIIAGGGVIVPIDRLPWLAAISQVLPLRNGLLAVRAVLHGQPWVGHLAMEMAVGGCWAVLGLLAYTWQAAQARRRGWDVFT